MKKGITRRAVAIEKGETLEERIMKKGITRRDFLKGSAVVAAAGLLGACSANSESSQQSQ